MYQVKLRRIAWCASISDHTSERPAYLLLPFISKIKNSQVRAAGLAGAKALAEATVRARKAAVNFMVAWRWVVGCDGLMEWSEVRGRASCQLSVGHHVRRALSPLLPFPGLSLKVT